MAGDGAEEVAASEATASPLEREVSRLRVFERMYDAIVGGTPSPVLLLDPSTGRALDANPAFLRAFGYTRANLSEADLGAIGWPEAPYTAAHALAWLRRAADGPQRFEWRTRGRPGEPTWLDVSLMTFEGERGPVAAAVLRDASEAKRRAQQVDDLEDRHFTLLEVAPDAIVFSSDGRVLFANSAAAALFGARSGGDLAGLDFETLVPPEHLAALRERLGASKLPGDRSPRWEHEILRLDGARVDVESVAVSVLFQGRLCRQTVLRDVTERRAQERALRESETRYREVAMLACDVVYELALDPSGDVRVLWSTSQAQGAPLLPAGRAIPREEWLTFQHPDDRAAYEERLPRLWRGETVEYEHRFRFPDGAWHWMRTILRPKGVREDCALRLLGSAKDVTALKEAEQKERALQEELAGAREALERTLLNNLSLGAPPRKIVRRDGGPPPDAPEYYFGGTEAMRTAHELAEIAASHDESVLITGETGTGKGQLAQWIHDHGPLASRSFVALNCSSLRGELLLSELFGHARGAFTSALKDRKGLVEEADGGTLFLDEIGELEPHAQALLLKVLEEKTFRRVGETALRRSDFRLITATNRDLWRETEGGRFRKDLYFRINVFPIALPSLHERREDIPALARHVLRSLGAASVALPDETLRLLREYPWPGNIRELRNALIRATLLARGGPVLPRHFPGLEPPAHEGAHDARSEGGHDDVATSPAHLRELLERFGGNRSRVARALGISRTTLYRHLQRLGLDRYEPGS